MPRYVLSVLHYMLIRCFLRCLANACSRDLTGVCVCVQLSRETELQQKLQEEQFCLLQCAVVEAEGIILDALSKVDDPMHVRCVCTPGMALEQASVLELYENRCSFLTWLHLVTPEYLINRAEITLVSIDKMQQSHAGYLRNLDGEVSAVRTCLNALTTENSVNDSVAWLYLPSRCQWAVEMCDSVFPPCSGHYC